MPRKFTITVLTASTLWLITLTMFIAHDARENETSNLARPEPVLTSTL
ncbi:hypothetical protein [Rhodalgimonas zhirmunskyi]|uniref:Uncharacterized protein n=1 Tax=Rhodalgimonas zhirmunskyi TaxID=2964767 RepID=A0AAJ1U391_9RHOB|nr:hypothetical protein [Rhodoalgimonas zhirmunskyi]MDQ2092911.1 hypothetical protein [Rhodoalgimonas zhirmunskyi]